MIALLLALAGPAAAQARHAVVRSGDTVESLAEDLGDPALASTIRELNALGPDAQPAVGAVLDLPGGTLAQDGLLLSLSGTAQVLRPGAGPAPGAAGMPLPAGTTVCTATDSYATVRLAVTASGDDHDDISLLDETCVTIDAAWSAPYGRGSLVSLERGSVRVRASATPGSVTVQSEAGATSGDSGGYRVTTEDGAARTEALTGRVSVFGAGREVRLSAGQGSRVRVGEAPSDPVDLLGPGAPIAPDAGAPLRRPDFTWSGVERALGYRVELSVTQDFSEVVRVEEVPENRWSPDFLFLPYRVPGLWWRVASFDRTGFLGTESEPRLLRYPAGVGP